MKKYKISNIDDNYNIYSSNNSLRVVFLLLENFFLVAIYKFHEMKISNNNNKFYYVYEYFKTEKERARERNITRKLYNYTFIF